MAKSISQKLLNAIADPILSLKANFATDSVSGVVEANLYKLSKRPDGS